MAIEERLIDANVVLAKQFTAGLSDASGNYYGHADVVFVNDIENAPIVDAVEVVRCKDCKNWQPVHEHIPHMECQIFCGAYEHGYPTNADDFCSHGERKAE